MRASFGRAAALLLAIAAVGCASTVARARTDSQVITREQMEQNRFQNAYDAVVALHANWLNVRAKTFGTTTGGQQPQVAVYVDENRMSGVDELGTIKIQQIDHIRHYGPTEATQRFGVGHTEGAIQVWTRPE
jgi:hypothetical protein